MRKVEVRNGGLTHSLTSFLPPIFTYLMNSLQCHCCAAVSKKRTRLFLYCLVFLCIFVYFFNINSPFDSERRPTPSKKGESLLPNVIRDHGSRWDDDDEFLSFFLSFFKYETERYYSSTLSESETSSSAPSSTAESRRSNGDSSACA